MQGEVKARAVELFENWRSGPGPGVEGRNIFL